MRLNLSILAISAFLIILWAYAAFSKLSDFKKYRQGLMQQVFPKWVGSVLTWVLPVIELCAMGLLIYAKTRLWGMYLSLFMMMAFTIYVGGAVYQFYNSYPCPCGGLFRKIGWYKHFKVNLWLTLVALAGVLLMELRGG